MTGPSSLLADLLADCETHGVRLLLAWDGRLAIDAPRDARTDDLLSRLREHKPQV